MTTLFVSDLHLSGERPEKIEIFKRLLHSASGRIEALYILGDLFEYWLGDDDDSPPHNEIIESLRGFGASGTRLALMRGNRDFLIGSRFAESTQCELLADPSVLDLYGEPTLLMHGDLLCTKDVDYQALRKTVTDPRWQQSVLSKTLEERRKLALDMRDGSKAHIRAQDEFIMDVEQKTVVDYLREHGVRALIHGHTHRPGIHEFALDGSAARRTVLGDWYASDSVLLCTPGGQRLLGVESYLRETGWPRQPSRPVS